LEKIVVSCRFSGSRVNDEMIAVVGPRSAKASRKVRSPFRSSPGPGRGRPARRTAERLGDDLDLDRMREVPDHQDRRIVGDQEVDPAPELALVDRERHPPLDAAACAGIRARHRHRADAQAIGDRADRLVAEKPIADAVLNRAEQRIDFFRVVGAHRRWSQPQGKIVAPLASRTPAPSVM